METARISVEQAAAALRESGALGRSGRVIALFDYLLAATLEGKSLREGDIAADVYGRGADFDPSLDAVVRVYIHKLRQILDSTELPGPGGPQHLMIPRGEYRLELVAMTQPPTTGDAPRPQRRIGKTLATTAIAAVLAGALLSGGATWLVMRHGETAGMDEARAVRALSPWRELMENGRPVVIVLGDYYMVGQSQDGVSVDRLVREFTINSRTDLDQWLMAQPDERRDYVDLDLRYLPVSSAAALRRLAPILLSADRDRPADMILASELTPKMLRNNNIVYVGYISGMQSLRPIAFGASRFTMGVTDDEIVDQTTGKRFFGQTGRGDHVHREYGLLQSFAGPNGNHIVVLAGTRDIALSQLTEMATSPTELALVGKAAGAATNFEGLYRLDGISRQNVSGKLELAGAIDSRRIWDH